MWGENLQGLFPFLAGVLHLYAFNIMTGVVLQIY